jgi:hypothetical protein
MVLLTFFLFLFCSLSSMEKNEYHIWVHGSRHAQYVFTDQMHSLGSYFRKCELQKSNNYNKYKGYFGNYLIVDPKPSKINYFYWGVDSSSKDGRLSANARKEAGKALFEILNSISEQDESSTFHVYAFSHGGNVIAECIEEIKHQKKNLKLNKVYFLDTPKTERTEKAIHRKNSNEEYIATMVYNVFPKKRAGFPWRLFDFTASFPCCANSFLFRRDNLFDIQINTEMPANHDFFNQESNFLIKKDGEVCETGILAETERKEKKTCSKNPFRWMLYYRKCIYLACFIAAVQKYVKQRKNKYEFRIVMR